MYPLSGENLSDQSEQANTIAWQAISHNLFVSSQEVNILLEAKQNIAFKESNLHSFVPVEHFS